MLLPLVNVRVFGDGINVPFIDTVFIAVPLFDPLTDGREPDCPEWCTWMPYQKAKHDEMGALRLA